MPSASRSRPHALSDRRHFKERLAIALNARGVMRRAKRPLLRAALADCKEAADLSPRHGGIWTNLGNVIKDMKFINSAVECHRRAIALEPDSADHHFNLAVAYAADVRSEEALEEIEIALKIKPNDPHLRWDRALNNLRLGRYEEGFRDYEARLETGALPERNPQGKPWRGEPYLVPPADRMAKAKAAIGDAGGRLKVGIVWSGSTTYKANHDRALPLRYFVDAFALPGVQFYSLQKGPPAAELKAFPDAGIIDLGPVMEDFADAAAVVEQLDLVIMTDSAVAHLSGALGKPVWVLLNHGAYWLWSTGCQNRSWYQSVHMIRAPDWNGWNRAFDIATMSIFKMSSFKIHTDKF